MSGQAIKWGALAFFLASCGSDPSTAGPRAPQANRGPSSTTSTTSTTEPPEASVAGRFVVDDSQVKAKGIDAQWIETTDPDGRAFFCLVVSERIASTDSLGFGLGVHCHERPAR